MKEGLWEETLDRIRETIPENEFSSWFNRLVFGKEEDGKITLYVPSAFVRDRFESSYRTTIEDIFNEIGDSNYSISFEIKKNAQNQQISKKTEEKPKTETSNSNPDQKLQKPSKPSADDMMFNPAYTFESFIPGDNSSFAYSACMAIAKNPGSAYNPCLLYGGVGLGKTHLIQSIGNYIRKNTKLKVVYVTAENFTNEYIQSLNDKNPQQFKNKYRKVSVLLIDDIHFLQRKEGIQNELFNTFNDLYDTGRQIVFTCDRPVEELKDISDRLRSRFERGLNIDLLPPNYETRVAILRKKCEEKNVEFSDEVIEYIASNISSNVRALESCLTKLIAYSELLHKDISLETAKEQLKHIISSNNDTSGISIDLIIKVVSNYFNVSPADIKGKNKNQSVVLPRQIAMYLCRNMTDFSTTEIGYEFGGKNHTTVMYNVQKIEARLNSSEKEINSVIEKLETQIKLESRK
ncbi:MAG: chromosomal replication initiator protein DnaA [Spirochaetales bacterium]|nr:chromosomal replication initiator protein DnaA [Spirochaetales bacterium]